MHFTREPIVETIISPKEGFKLIVRNTKIGSHEEYVVDALEVITFGKATFYRSVEKKPFLLPISDFEVVESREAKIALKARDERPSRDERPPRAAKQASDSSDDEAAPSAAPREAREPREPRDRGRRDRKKNRRRRGEEPSAVQEAANAFDEFIEVPDQADGRLVHSPDQAVLPTSHNLGILIPPPSTLISESFGGSRSHGSPEAPTAFDDPDYKLERNTDTL